jgi:hypothetical protein
MILKANDKVCNGTANIPMTHESSHAETANEDNAHHLL